MDDNAVPPVKPADKGNDLPDWLRDTVVSSAPAKPVEPPPAPSLAPSQSSLPPKEEEPELLPPPSARVLIKPVILATLIGLVVTTSIGAFFLLQKGRFPLQKKAQVPISACFFNVGDIGNPTLFNHGAVTYEDGSNHIVAHWGFPNGGGTAGKKDYLVKLVKCKNPSQCADDGVSGDRVYAQCHTLEVNAEGRGEVALDFFLDQWAKCNDYQLDICGPNDGPECPNPTYGIRYPALTNCEGPTATLTPTATATPPTQATSTPTNTPTLTPTPTNTPTLTPTPTTPPGCPYIFSVVGLNLTAAVGDRPTIYVQAGETLDAPTVKVSKDGSKIEDLILVPGSVTCSSGRCNHQFTPLTSAFSVGTYTFEFFVEGIAASCAVRTVTVSSGETAVCTELTAFKEGSSPPSSANLKEGDTVRFVITPSGTVEAAVVRLFKDGVKVGDLSASIYQISKWSVTYTIPVGGGGSYEAQGFVKAGGVWK